MSSTSKRGKIFRPIGDRHHARIAHRSRLVASPSLRRGGWRGTCSERPNKQRTHPELVGAWWSSPPRLVDAGRGSPCVREPSGEAKAKFVPRVLDGRDRQAWHHRWASLLACASARAFALSLLDCRLAVGSDRVILSTSVVNVPSLAALRVLGTFSFQTE